MKHVSRILTAAVVAAMAGAAANVANATVGADYAPPTVVPGTVSPTTGHAVPGTGNPAFAAVDYSAAITKSGTNYVLSIASTTKNFGVCNFSSLANPASYSVGSETIAITAVFNSAGVFTSGVETITGSVAACTIGCPGGKTWKAGSGTLFKATLKSATVDTTDEALGFSITGFSGWAASSASNGSTYGFTAGPTNYESLWLYSTQAVAAGSVPSSTTFISGGLTNLGTAGTTSPYTQGSLYTSTGNAAWNSFLAALANKGVGLKAQTVYDIGSYSTVPLPMSGILLTGGLAGLGFFARRRTSVVAA